VIDISDMHKIEGKETKVFGNKIIGLPSYDNFKYEHFVVPIEISIGDSIKTIPMLNKKSIDMMKSVFEKEAQKRIEMLTKSSNSEVLKEYRDSIRRFNEAITEKVIPY
jgi:hypothetical protein